MIEKKPTPDFEYNTYHLNCIDTLVEVFRGSILPIVERIESGK
jgi:hypothetical protein